MVYTRSLELLTGGQSESVAVSGTSAQSSAYTVPELVVTVLVHTFVRQGTNPTALANGTDQLLLGPNSYRLSGITSGNKLAFITADASSSTVYITPSS